MSNRTLAVIEEFNSLPQIEQLAVYEAIARKVTPADYGPLSDEDLTAIAAETFAVLDQEEDRARVACPAVGSAEEDHPACSRNEGQADLSRRSSSQAGLVPP